MFAKLDQTISSTYLVSSGTYVFFPFQVTETFSTHASWTAPQPGTYYTTVVAYNRALDPSLPVCSDGVTVDQTPPQLSRVGVSNSRISPGLTTTNTGDVWFIDGQRRRSEVKDADDSCRYETNSCQVPQILE